MRPNWGVALFAWKAGHKLAYQFEDGVLRKFREQYGHLFQPVELSEEDRVSTVEMLLESLGDRLPGEPNSSVSAGAAIASADILDAQVVLFREMFADSFRDEAFIRDYRGDTETERRIKRHTEPAMVEAQELLNAEAIAKLLEADDAAEIWDRAVTVMSNCDLLTASKLKPVTDLPKAARAKLGRALAERLHGERKERAGFRVFARAVKEVTGKRISWGVATVVPALVHPDEEFVVRPSISRSFSNAYDLELSLPKTARYPAYRRTRHLLNEIKSSLEHRGLLPVDNLDIYRFMHLTLRRKAIGRLEDIMSERNNEDTTSELAA